MWKERYRLGIEAIDKQHKQLFEKTAELVQEIEGAQRPEVYKKIIKFLQDYVVCHFQEEEAYLESLEYADLEAHKQQHREFTQAVAKCILQLEQTQYSLQAAKRLAGMLSAWLIYHVVNEDLKYVGQGKEVLPVQSASYLEYFVNSTAQVLKMMGGLSPQEITTQQVYRDLGDGDIFIEIGLIGDLKGKVVFAFSKQFAFNLLENLMSFTPVEIDELVYSALAEMSNIASGNGTIAISEKGTACDICPPKILEHSPGVLPIREEMKLVTSVGQMTVALYLD